MILDVVLEKLRPNLKDGLTGPVINNLVDGLRKDEVLNKDETEAILHKTNIRPDQARYLIDSVTVKGCEASEHFFDILEKSDKTVYNNLKIAILLKERLPTTTPSVSHETTGRRET